MALKGMAESVAYLWIKQSVRVSDVVLVTVKSIIGSWRRMEVYVRGARHDKNSQQAAPNYYEPHGLLQLQKSRDILEIYC